MRILFASDIHGNLILLEKIKKLYKDVNPDIMIFGGDLCPKGFAAITSKGTFWLEVLKNGKINLPHVNESILMKENLKQIGIIPVKLSDKEFEEIKKNVGAIRQLKIKYQNDFLSYFLKDFKSMKPYFILGNDDFKEIEKTANKSEFYINEKILQIGRINIFGFSYVNSTPFENKGWDMSEEEISKKLDKFNFGSVNSDFIFVSHALPYNSSLDVVEGINVGSLAIRKFIERRQPFLSLHGHVHESAGTSKIGKTICVNVGSGHMEDLLKAVVIDTPDKIKFVSL